MATFEPIAALLRQRGNDLRADDIEEIEYLLTQVPVDRYAEAAGWAWEAVALIVNDPEYEGDARVPVAESD